MSGFARFRKPEPLPEPPENALMEALDNFAWVVDPTRRVSQPLTSAQLDTIGAEWRARFPWR